MIADQDSQKPVTDYDRPQPSARIAIVEDDADQCASMSEYLELLGHSVWCSPSAQDFYRRLAVAPVDLVILDIGLPGENGLSVAQHIAQTGVGIIIVSARSQVGDRVNGMGAGADSYLVKPVDLRELAAHIQALQRRLNPPGDSPDADQPGWGLSRQRRQLVTTEGQAVALTPSEFALLACLTENGGECSRQRIAEALDNNPSQFSFHRIDVLLSRLRKKVKAATDLDLPVASAPPQKLEFTHPMTWT